MIANFLIKCAYHAYRSSFVYKLDMPSYFFWKPLFSYRLQTTIDFPIHLSYKTGHFWGLYKIPSSSISKINHFIGIIMINFHCKKNMNIGPSLNFWEQGPFLRGTSSSATCRTIGTIKTCFILSLNDSIISHQEWIHSASLKLHLFI